MGSEVSVSQGCHKLFTRSYSISAWPTVLTLVCVEKTISDKLRTSQGWRTHIGRVHVHTFFLQSIVYRRTRPYLVVQSCPNPFFRDALDWFNDLGTPMVAEDNSEV